MSRMSRVKTIQQHRHIQRLEERIERAERRLHQALHDFHTNPALEQDQVDECREKLVHLRGLLVEAHRYTGRSRKTLRVKRVK